VIRRHGVEREIAVALSRDVALRIAPFTRDGIAFLRRSVMDGNKSATQKVVAGAAKPDRGHFFLNYGWVLGRGRSGLATTRSSGAHEAHCSLKQSGGRSRRRRHVPRVSVSGKALSRPNSRCWRIRVPIEIEALGSLEIAASAREAGRSKNFVGPDAKRFRSAVRKKL